MVLGLLGRACVNRGGPLKVFVGFQMLGVAINLGGSHQVSCFVPWEFVGRCFCAFWYFFEGH